MARSISLTIRPPTHSEFTAHADNGPIYIPGSIVLIRGPRQTIGDPFRILQTLLSVKSSGNDVSISWTVPSINFVLQQNATLRRSDWLEVEASRILNPTNLHYEVNLVPAKEPRFFRLASQ